MDVLRSSGRVAMATLAMLLLVPPSAQAREVSGVWMNDDGQWAVEVERCGDRRCGRLVWLKSPLDQAGRPLRDGNNPDPAARQRPLCGVEIIKDLTLQNDGSWDGGSIYDPEEGKVYSVMLKSDAADRLEVRGYLGIKALGETMIWTRAPAELKQCQPDTTPKPK